MKICSALLIIRKMQIKTTVTLPPHTGQNGHYQKSTNCKWWRGCGEKGTFLDFWWECELVLPLWRTVWRLLKKLKIDLPYDPAIPLLGIYLKKTIFWKDAYTLSFLNNIISFPLYLLEKSVLESFKEVWNSVFDTFLCSHFLIGPQTFQASGLFIFCYFVFFFSFD